LSELKVEHGFLPAQKKNLIAAATFAAGHTLFIPLEVLAVVPSRAMERYMLAILQNTNARRCRRA
jgi:hypothetical protein